MSQRARIALVNDVPEYLQLIVDYLSAEGYEILTIPNHQHAFEQIQESNPDIIICDVTFDNEQRGFALIDMLYLEPKTRDIPFILCASATQRVQEVSPALAAKNITWLEKPFEIEELISLLKRIEQTDRNV
jgi:CheY-like chemotaxis protein